MKAKQLLFAAFQGRIFKGEVIKPIVHEILWGEIKPKKSYIQTFDGMEFWQIAASVVFTTTKGEKCWLYEID